MASLAQRVRRTAGITGIGPGRRIGLWIERLDGGTEGLFFQARHRPGMNGVDPGPLYVERPGRQASRARGLLGQIHLVPESGVVIGIEPAKTGPGDTDVAG